MGTPFSYTVPTVPVFQDPAVKLTNQDQAKPGLSHQSQRFVWTEGIEPGFQLVELQYDHRATVCKAAHPTFTFPSQSYSHSGNPKHVRLRPQGS